MDTDVRSSLASNHKRKARHTAAAVGDLKDSILKGIMTECRTSRVDERDWDVFWDTEHPTETVEQTPVWLKSV